MTDTAGNPDDMLKRVTRRYMVRNASIAATGMILLPSFFTSCKKDNNDAGGGIVVGGVGGTQLSIAELEQAAANLRRMRVWITDLYPLCIEYEDAVFHALASTKETPSWTKFILDVYIDIVIALASAAAVVSGAAPAVPAFAFLSAILHDWGSSGNGTPPDILDAEFAQFQFGHVRMQLAMEQQLSALVDPTNNYNNLTTAWNQDIQFNGNTYTLKDLASSNFPDLGDAYNALQRAALLSFEKALWNLVIMKCCTLAKVSNWYLYIYATPYSSYPYTSVVEYAQKEMYPQNKGNYLRGGFLGDNGTYKTYVLQSWSLGINGNTFPDEASKRLFMDDTPGHIINKDALFQRQYVFQQFALTKPVELLVYLDLDTAPNVNICNRVECNNDWTFTGGVFPELTH